SESVDSPQALWNPIAMLLSATGLGSRWGNDAALPTPDTPAPPQQYTLPSVRTAQVPPRPIARARVDTTCSTNVPTPALEDPVIVVVPSASAATKPLDETVATPSAELVQ